MINDIVAVKVNNGWQMNVYNLTTDHREDIVTVENRNHADFTAGCIVDEVTKHEISDRREKRKTVTTRSSFTSGGHR